MRTFTQTSLLFAQTAALMLVSLSSGWAGNDPPPPPPTNLIAVPGDGRITVHWDPAVGASTYQVWWSETPGLANLTPTQRPHAVNTSQAWWPINSLTNGTRYYIIVTALGSNYAESGASVEVSAVPLASVIPDPPPNIRATGDASSVIVSWDISNTAEDYNLYYRPTTPGVTKANGTKVGPLARGSTSTKVSNLTPDICYYFVLTGVNGTNESVESNEVCATPNP